MDGADSHGLVRFDHVAYTFSGTVGSNPVPVLRDLDLRIDAGEFVALIGPSGCGKSTLLAMLAGYLLPDAGRVMFEGRPVEGPGRARMMVFQRPTLFPWLTSAQNIAYGLTLRANRKFGRTVKHRVDEMLRLVQLESFADHYPNELSGGMQQRIEIARALAVDPQVLLMDEPLGALDALTRRAMQREVLRIWATTAKTILFVTHDIDEAVVMADRIVVMAGRPSSVLDQITVGLPRPRRRDDLEVTRLSRRLATLLEDSPSCDA